MLGNIIFGSVWVLISAIASQKALRHTSSAWGKGIRGARKAAGKVRSVVRRRRK